MTYVSNCMKPLLLSLAIASASLIALPAAYAAEPVMCPAIYQPVCGAQQVECIKAPCYPVYHTYGNSCELGAAGNATFIHDGECTATETGPIKPVEPYVPPANCTAWFDGCNSCGRTTGSGAICTQMACIGPRAPGRCTAYATPPAKPVPPPASVVSSPAPVSTSSVAVDATATPATTTPAHPGFFRSLWAHIVSWFSWL